MISPSAKQKGKGHMNVIVLIIICLAAFIVSILVACKTKLNVGIIAMAFAYVIGCFFMNMSVSDVIALFPVKILFLLFSVCFFYGYAIQNGTLQIIADFIIYRFRNKIKFMPFVLYFLAFGLALLGSSAPAISSFLAPICIVLGFSTGIHYLIMVIILCIGAGAGSLVPWGQGGVIIRGIIESTEYAEDASLITLKISANLLLTGLLALVIAYVVFRGYRAEPCEIKEPERFNKVQKKTLRILVIVLLFVFIPTMVNTIFPAPNVQKIARLFDIQMLSIVGAVFCGILHLGDERKVLMHSVPWNTIIMVGGICMLLGVTKDTGLFDYLTKALNQNIPGIIVGGCLALIGGIMSFFTGALTVVVPLILPTALMIAAESEFSAAALASALVIGATATSTSPFSAGGSFILSCIPDAKVRDSMFQKQFLFTWLLLLLVLLLTFTGVYSIL